MSWLMATAYDFALRGAERKHLAAWRTEVLDQVVGEVLEIGAGTGANLEHYSAQVRRLVLIEPDPSMRSRLKRKLASTDRPVEVGDSAAESLPYANASFDWVVSTLVLCSVRDPQRALSEIHRVLRPGGKLAFLEHVLDPEDDRNRRRQRRYQPLWGLIADHCQVIRDTASEIREAGFEIANLTQERMDIGPRIVRPMIRGLAER
jgi:ubiquinone/menaquinone biosynthesis C-methylase UbiE